MSSAYPKDIYPDTWAIRKVIELVDDGDKFNYGIKQEATKQLDELQRLVRKGRRASAKISRWR